MDDNLYAGLASVFHEPRRLAIVSGLCAAGGAQTFVELRTQLDLTDGNLSRHLKALEVAGVVRLRREFVGVKPRTTVILTEAGRAQFAAYLDSLEAVLAHAAAAVEARVPRRGVTPAPGARAAEV
jgi:DNA-binding MarR family transcriptional regulator